MSFIGNKLLAAASGRAAAEPLSVEDVFSTYLYIGNSDTTPNTTVQSISTGIDIQGEGGLLWVKSRDSSQDHFLTSPELFFESNPQYGDLNSNSTADVGYLKSTFGDSAWSSDGFNVGDTLSVPGERYVSWSFRKAPKFLDVVAYSGDGVAGREIPHDLGSVPGMIIVKATNSSQNWVVYHRGLSALDKELYLNLSLAEQTGGAFNSTAPTASVFTVGNNALSNLNGVEYIAYLFAHNDGDGEFGPNSDQDIIKCGNYTGTGSAGNEINVGFEPQYLLIKNADGSNGWYQYDILRGFNHSDSNVALFPSASSGEATSNQVSPTPNGFITTGGGGAINGSGDNYIYIAIRRGPMRPPESGTEVFAMSQRFTPPSYVSGFPVDMAFWTEMAEPAIGNRVGSRLIAETKMEFNSSDATITEINYEFDYMDGWYSSSVATDLMQSWMFRRAPGFFDVVVYTGDGIAGRTVPHNLGVAPEMMIVKCIDAAIGWQVYHVALGNTGGLYVNTTTNPSPVIWWNNTDPSSTSFSLGNSTGNNSGFTFIAYLFATLPGISKVGSYTGNGSSQTIDCGFSSGARFVLIKRTDAAGDWHIWDTKRGIVSGTEGYLELNTTNAEDTSTDSIDPDSTGFIVNQNATTDINASGGEYIFYAVA